MTVDTAQRISSSHTFFIHFFKGLTTQLRKLIKLDNHTLSINIISDLTRSRVDLILENAFLHQQLIVLERPEPKPRECVLLVMLSQSTSILEAGTDDRVAGHLDPLVS